MVARWIEVLGNLNLISSKEQAKKTHLLTFLSRINTEDDEQTAFVFNIVMDAEQYSTNSGSLGWQLQKVQRVKLQDLEQNE